MMVLDEKFRVHQGCYNPSRGGMNVCTNCHGSPSNSVISHFTQISWQPIQQLAKYFTVDQNGLTNLLYHPSSHASSIISKNDRLRFFREMYSIGLYYMNWLPDSKSLTWVKNSWLVHETKKVFWLLSRKLCVRWASRSWTTYKNHFSLLLESTNIKPPRYTEE